MTDQTYSKTELMICVAARLFQDGTTAFIGTGIPMLAAMLAAKTKAPNLVPVFEFGGLGAIMEELPRAVGEARTFHKGLVAAGICELMETAQRGFIDYGFLGGAQIDPYGNLNSVTIGDHDHPKARLPGSGGGNDVGSQCWMTVAIMQHDKRRFVPKVDFVTTPGYLTGELARENAGLPRGTRPINVVSTLALMDYDTRPGGSYRMRLAATHPGVSVNEVIDNTGFELIIPEHVPMNEPPSAEELRLLREEIDPERFYI
ncbi:MAG: 3-oxoacid CoA-transferase [Anaerolineales bacterium]|nr:3-oxoacid CoA-transferase [Anaerolineae bacterium]PWB55827.1 MAG: 3-oxoacid CoA-transferase [Anaerolineales bacterium]